MSAVRMRRFTPLAVVLLGLLIAGIIPVSLPANDTTILESESKRPIGEIASGVAVTEQFPAAAPAIVSVSLLLATYQRTNHGMLRITLLANTNGQWQEQAVRAVDTATLTDNAYYTLTFPSPLPTTKGQNIRITLQSDSRPGDAVTWWSNPDMQPPGFALTVNGRTLPGNGIYWVAYTPQSGRLFQMAGEIWRRSTVFLTVGWQAILVLGLVILAASLPALTRRLDDAPRERPES